jgi:ubiquinone/menaquinone biosynthesis C-methylase UbiE
MTMTETEYTNNKANPHPPQHPTSRLSKDDIQNIYDGFASKYNLEEWVNNHIFGVKRLRRRLFGQAQGKVLDVAAGIGGNFPYLPRESEIIAIDLSPGMLDKARARAKELGLKVTFQVMDAEALDFPDDTFDTVISSLSTCTFPDPIKALREMARVVKPDGQILLLGPVQK